MATQIQLRRGSTSQHSSFTGAVGEATVDTDLDVIRVHDGSTAGGHVMVGTAATQTLTNKTLGDLKESVFAITDGGSVDLDPGNGPIQTWTLGANRTATANNFAAGQSMMLLVDDGTNYSLAFPTMTWVGGSAPILPTTGYAVIELWKVGSTLYGASVGNVA